MTKKPNPGAAFSAIIKARREVDSDTPAEPVEAAPLVEEPQAPPSPAPLPPAISKAPPAAKKARNGKSSDANYDQYSVYLRKDTRKKVKRALDDADNGTDFSELVEELLEQWLASRT